MQVAYATPLYRYFLPSELYRQGAVRKNLTYFCPLILVTMADLKKQEYYKNNKKKRLEYQRKYYEMNKTSIAEKRERERAEDPKWREKQRAYNRAYYLQNKERIMEQRRLKKQGTENRSQE